MNAFKSVLYEVRRQEMGGVYSPIDWFNDQRSADNYAAMCNLDDPLRCYSVEVIQRPPGLFFTFLDRELGWMLLREWGGRPWLFYKHADGHWVSLREATQDDLDNLHINPN